MRYTNKFLDAKILVLNKVTGNPITAYTKTAEGYKANVGNFSVERTCGYHNLVQIVNESGGQRLLTSGTRGDMVLFITAYLQGYQEAREVKS
jgi:hypothetical protein